MNILYIAYSCDPYFGSENKIGWNIPLEASKSHRVFVLTKPEHKKNIQNYCKENNIENIDFFYVDIKDIYKRAFRPPFYSGRLNIWHKKAFPVAKKICSENSIDIIHQIAPVEFRSIGKYYKIPGVKFVCGPLAGGQSIPKGLLSYTGDKKKTEIIREIINDFYRFRLRINGRLKKCDEILYANYETKEYLEPNKERTVIPETAITDGELSDSKRTVKNEKFTFLVVSRFVATKGYNLLFDALCRLPEELDYKLKIIGYGPDENKVKILYSANEKVAARTEFLGRLPFEKMKEQYENADAFIFPTFREATGSVILEAMANSLPVITINKFGGRIICDNDTAFLFDGNAKEDYINSLCGIIACCIENPEEAAKKGTAARIKAGQFTFEKKLETFNEIYDRLKNE